MDGLPFFCYSYLGQYKLNEIHNGALFASNLVTATIQGNIQQERRHISVFYARRISKFKEYEFQQGFSTVNGVCTLKKLSLRQSKTYMLGLTGTPFRFIRGNLKY